MFELFDNQKKGIDVNNDWHSWYPVMSIKAELAHFIEPFWSVMAIPSQQLVQMCFQASMEWSTVSPSESLVHLLHLWQDSKGQ
jgi:hypothetical protein